MLFPSPQILHSGEAFKNESNVSFQTLVNAVKGIHDFIHPLRFVHTDNATGAFGVVFLVKCHEYIGSCPFSKGEAIQNRHVLVFSQGTEFLQEISGRSVEADINERLVLVQRGLNEIQAEYGCETSCIIVPYHIVADIKAAQKPV